MGALWGGGAQVALRLRELRDKKLCKGHVISRSLADIKMIQKFRRRFTLRAPHALANVPAMRVGPWSKTDSAAQ